MKMRVFIFLMLFLGIKFQVEASNLQRESSYPYLSGDTVRFFADWRLSREEDFQPEKVQLGDLIFIEHDYLPLFETDYLPKIESPIIVLSPYNEHSDISLPGPHEKLAASEKIGCWFVVNIDQPPTEKIQPIPIGICNKIHPHGDTDLFSRYVKRPSISDKTIYVFVNFRFGSNPEERIPCWDYFAKQSFATVWYFPVESEQRSQELFWNDMSRSYFVVSPPGTGVDVFRTWEALLMGCYPIVKRSFLNPLYENLPVVIVEDWEEVTMEFLNEKLMEFQDKEFAWEKLYAPYWFDKIRDVQKKIRGSLQLSSN